MTGHLDWRTTRVREDGRQEIHIRPLDSTNPADVVHLDVAQSDLLGKLLNEAAQDGELDWPRARKAILRAFYKSGRPQAR